MRFMERSRRAALLTCAVWACGAAVGVRADEASVAEQTVDALNKVWGKHPGFRANHAKGVVAEGSFVASKQAAGLSKAALFSGKAIPITVRFSDSGGLPDVADGSGNANPHGMAIKFHLPDGGGDVDVVQNSLKFFPVATGAGFRDLLLAVAASPSGSAKPTKLDTFFASHPAAPRALGSVATPASFAQETYNGVDAFIFVNAAGTRQAFRFKTVPVAGEVHLSAADAGQRKPDFLVDELPARLKGAPVRFHLLAQLADPGDQTKDATQPWPATRTLVDMGMITLTNGVADSDAAQKTLLFLPGNLTAGIEPSDDPLIDARDDAYAVSFSRRSPQ
jgi:catalase